MANSPAQDAQSAQGAQDAQDTTDTQPAATQPADTIERQARSDSRESVTSPARPKFGTVPEHPKEKRERAFQMFKAGTKQIDISFELRIPIGTINAWANRDKWELRKDVETAGVSAETSASVAKALSTRDASVEPSNLELAEKQERYQTLTGDAAVRFSEYLATLDGEEITNKADKLLKADQIARKALKLETEKPSQVIQIAVLSQSPDKQDRKSSEQAAPSTITLDI